MDIQPTQQQQPVSDDNELAKVLAGVDDKVASDDSKPADDSPAPSSTSDTSDAPAQPAELQAPPVTPPPLGGSVDLEPIKKEAIEELRPLVDKLNLPPEEKFDIYLLIIRSTDDQSLIEPAHETAKNITDETRRAQALLDIIKEIEFFSHPPQQQEGPVAPAPEPSETQAS